MKPPSQITKIEPQIPVILFSLHVSDDLYRHFKTDGIRGAVAKGDAARDLAQAVETVLARRNFFPGPENRFELIILGIGDLTGVADAGRLWGGNQRLPFAPSRWGTFINTAHLR